MKIKYFFVFLLTSLFAISSLAESGSGYKYFKASISYDGATIENMPVLLRLSEENILGFSHSDVVNKSFKITDKDQNLLSYEIDTWNESGESTIWVKVPNFSSGQILDVRYGLDYTSDAEMENVWENYISVWHLEDVNTEDRASDYDGIGNGSVAVTEDGKIGKAVTFPGTDNSSIYCGATLPNSELTDGFTVEGWINPNTYTGNRAFFGKKDFISIRTSSANHVVITTPGKADHGLKGLSLPPLNDWWHIAVTFAKSSSKGAKLYINGALASSVDAKDINNKIDPTDMWIGGNQWSQLFSGAIDEVRLMKGIASPEYLAAEYAAMGNTEVISYSNVVNGGMGSAEIKSPPSIIWNGSAFEFSCEIYTGAGRMFAIYENTFTGAAFTGAKSFLCKILGKMLDFRIHIYYNICIMKKEILSSSRSREEILAEIASLPQSVQGTISSYKNTRKDGSVVVYHNLQYTHKGKNHSFAIPVDKVDEFKSAVKAGKKLRDLIFELSLVNTRDIINPQSSVKKKHMK